MSNNARREMIISLGIGLNNKLLNVNDQIRVMRKNKLNFAELKEQRKVCEKAVNKCATLLRKMDGMLDIELDTDIENLKQLRLSM